MQVKSSFYNEFIPVEETDEFLLYNIITGGLNVLNKNIGNLLKSFTDEAFAMSDFLEFEPVLENLLQEGFLVESSIDEREIYKDNYIKSQAMKFKNSSHIGLTIGTTITCNMGCPYCFETVKPNKSLRDINVINGIVDYIENMINSAPVTKWASLSITWYGGEPLINRDAIRILSEKFIQLSAKFNIPYDAMIITNGILLDEETWDFLKKHKVGRVQITIDGAKEVHNEYRPLKKANEKNYEKILENIAMMPAGIETNIRINTDKRVADTFETLLDDLEAYNIWPQRHESVSLALAWLRSYKGADSSSLITFSQTEYFDAQNMFSKLQVKRFNNWANKVGIKKESKLKWKLPQKQSDCATYVSPYFFTFDPEGTIHKCWETVHDTKMSSGLNVFRNWNPEDFDSYLNYSRTKVHPVCYNCKFNPVCEGLSCAYDTLSGLKENEFPCTPWKTKLPGYFKEMFLLHKNEPESVAFVNSAEKHHQTHSNK